MDKIVFTASLVLLHGRVVHKSEKNKSQFSRHAYTFHVFDEGVSQYSEQNWLQTKVGFKQLYGQKSQNN
jgi:ectoine hydroxylase-related dioxygenase (phytanoyl-CoA dioxygenase family)